MTKFYGKIGWYVGDEETAPGVIVNKLVYREYKGDVIRNIRRWDTGEGLNDDLALDNSLSIIADDFAFENLSTIRCVEWMGAKWKVTRVEIQPPRLILTIGGVYNESEIGTSSDSSGDSGFEAGIFSTSSYC